MLTPREKYAAPPFIFWVTPLARGSLLTDMRNRFDQLAKQIGKATLEGSGLTVVHAEITPEPLHADLLHEPDPAKAAERKRLGLLGRLVSIPCLLEPYSDAPSAEEFRACLTKHLAWWQQRARRQRADGKKSDERPRRKPVDPFLWILCGGAPSSILTKLTLKATSEWPAGVYLFANDVLRVGFVVASELPRERTTLLVRLMAAGSALPQAIEDLHALPPDAYERSAAERPLLHFQHAVAQQPTRTPDEQEFLNTMLKTWEETRTESLAEGRIENAAEYVLDVLHARGIAVPPAARKRILAQKDPKQLKIWHQKAIIAASVDDLFKSRS
ncbi:MAG TPA: hypothetical protein VHT91_42110 [Kofleriaceae bacterium]|jgi:hypothetical protein|nr:hypothetical protein [Kofleriaceae bacterium]